MKTGLGGQVMFERIASVLRALKQNPNTICPYFVYSVCNSQSYNFWLSVLTNFEYASQPRLKVGTEPLPWLSFTAIDFLKATITDTMDVFEWGGGSSTIFFAGRCCTVRSVEESQQWFQIISNTMKKRNITNVELLLSEIDTVDYASSSYVNMIGENRYDLILIDGYDVPPFQWRPACFALAENRVKEGGLILVDDSWRYTGLRSSNRAKSYKVFEGLGPARLGVTSTDAYFY